MRKRNIVICDRDLVFAENLAAYMNTCEDRGFKAFAFSSWQQAERAVGEDGAEILLACPDCAPEKKPDNVRYLVLLTGDEEPDPERSREPGGQEDPDTRPQVYKYQAASRLLGEVMELCAGLEQGAGASSAAGNGASWIAVISPVGRCGKTAFAVALGKKLAREKRTLYISLEDFAGFAPRKEAAANGDLSDLLLYCRRSGGDLSLKLNSMLGRWGELWYIPPAASFCDIQDAGENEWLNLLEAISAAGLYEIIILDMGFLPEEALDILERCRRIYIPGLDDPVSGEKLQQFRKTLQGASSLMEKRVVSLRLPMVSGIMLQQFPSNVCQGKMEEFVEKLLVWEKEKERDGKHAYT